ncbi:putative WD-repeat protein [Ixodes scapularis]
MQVTVVETPVLSIQCNWSDVLRERNGDAWVTCKCRGQPGIHGKLKRTGLNPDGTPVVSASDRFQVLGVTKNSIRVSHTDPNCQTCFLKPTTAFSNIHQKSVPCLDVTSGFLGVSVSGCNEMRIWDTRTGEVRRELEGHVWDIYTCRFFPSGVVVLSGGADMQLKIWSAETGKCPVTMKGHSAAIHDTCVVDQGRNVISASKDGTARLWDCGQSACLSTLAEFEHDAINCCALGSSAAIDLGCREEPSNDREVGTEGKLLVVGTEAGTFRGVGVHSRQTVFELKAPSAINCCCSMGQNRFLYGTQDGDIYMLDARQPREPSLTWANSSSPALSLITHKQGFMVGRADGSCSFEPLEGAQSFCLTGPDCEPVYHIASDGDCIYTACRDAVIRKYKMSDF